MATKSVKIDAAVHSRAKLYCGARLTIGAFITEAVEAVLDAHDKLLTGKIEKFMGKRKGEK